MNNAILHNDFFFSTCLHWRYSSLSAFLKKNRKPPRRHGSSTISSARCLKKIDYPGINNYSQFSFDGLGQYRKITETVAGSITSTKSFVSEDDEMFEERDGSSSLISQFFNYGEITSSNQRFYTLDHLDSIRQLVGSAGVVLSDYYNDPYGQQTRLTGTIDSSFQYASYYYHQRSMQYLTATRPYSASLGRWVSRDSIEEGDGPNLYTYVGNDPVNWVDPLGLAASMSSGGGSGTPSSSAAPTSNGSGHRSSNNNRRGGGRRGGGGKGRHKRTKEDCYDCCYRRFLWCYVVCTVYLKLPCDYCADICFQSYIECMEGCNKDPNHCKGF